ncbi:sugar ABC transporter permease [Sulfolobales archaeon HS-7]|nr:sugar ABC transporter permease [Sulfolobales archaeon HS-7]
MEKSKFRFFSRKFWRKTSRVSGYFYLLPAIAVMFFLFLYPVAYAVYISFTNFNLFHFFKYTFVGFHNYYLILTSPTFSQLLVNTVIWTVGSLIPMIAIGLLLALILNQKEIRMKRLFFSLILVPWAFPAFISLLVWLGMWNYEYGIINKFLGLIHVAPLNWLNIPTPAWEALIITNVWLSFPYYTAIFLSSLQSIPPELYEVASIDGANMWSRFTRVTLPMLKNAMAFIGISGFIFTWNNFYPIYLLTGGGPGTSTDILIVYTYQEAYSFENYSLSAAYSFISVIILTVMGILMFKYSRILEER